MAPFRNSTSLHPPDSGVTDVRMGGGNGVAVGVNVADGNAEGVGIGVAGAEGVAVGDAPNVDSALKPDEAHSRAPST